LDAELIKLNKGELSRISELIYQVMDGEEISQDHLSQKEAAYKKTVDMLMGRKLYSHSWLAE
jgi:5-methyltetrahydrofolate corrinoid/iron sulfur protein methyltransferase